MIKGNLLFSELISNYRWVAHIDNETLHGTLNATYREVVVGINMTAHSDAEKDFATITTKILHVGHIDIKISSDFDSKSTEFLDTKAKSQLLVTMPKVMDYSFSKFAEYFAEDMNRYWPYWKNGAKEN
ncbi:hypothetical protein QAD02_019170 [Eretmocerus hayati]|uniref:Uncharacterized protein n=1 Tax=Eretmocerus hayati TaxID=131215 RepID=A0ACC2PIW0_9HYME|nr:hypothetical protein QAD02_019170 [Eretmocerus hayati]